MAVMVTIPTDQLGETEQYIHAEGDGFDVDAAGVLVIFTGGLNVEKLAAYKSWISVRVMSVEEAHALRR